MTVIRPIKKQPNLQQPLVKRTLKDKTIENILGLKKLEYQQMSQKELLNILIECRQTNQALKH